MSSELENKIKIIIKQIQEHIWTEDSKKKHCEYDNHLNHVWQKQEHNQNNETFYGLNTSIN